MTTAQHDDKQITHISSHFRPIHSWYPASTQWRGRRSRRRRKEFLLLKKLPSPSPSSPQKNNNKQKTHYFLWKRFSIIHYLKHASKPKVKYSYCSGMRREDWRFLCEWWDNTSSLFPTLLFIERRSGVPIAPCILSLRGNFCSHPPSHPHPTLSTACFSIVSGVLKRQFPCNCLCVLLPSPSCWNSSAGLWDQGWTFPWPLGRPGFFYVRFVVVSLICSFCLLCLGTKEKMTWDIKREKNVWQLLESK